MRTSFALALLIASPVLITVTACDKPSPPPSYIEGTVEAKEYERAVYGTKKVDITKRKCDFRGRNCKQVTTGSEEHAYIKTPACFELEILTADKRLVEICNIDAYEALDPGDPFDGSKYNEVAP